MKLEIAAFILVLALFGIAYCHDTTRAHSEQIIHCERNITYTEANKVMELLNENGTFSEFYDTNGDGLRDIEAISYTHGLDADGALLHDTFPFIYIVDIDFDGRPDKSYVDVSGKGNCNDIRFYQDLRDPAAYWPDYDVQGGGTL